MGDSGRTKVTKKELEDAQYLWGAFTGLMKYSVIGTVALLVILALVFIA